MGAVMAIQAGMAVLGAVSSAKQSKDNAEASMQAATANAAGTIAEATRQQGEVVKVGEEDMTDRSREANRALGSLMAGIGDMGTSDSMAGRLIVDLAGAEGRDLGRIMRNTEGQLESLQSKKGAARQGNVNAIKLAKNQAKAGTTSAILGGATQIAGAGVNEYQRNASLQISKNKVT